MYHSLIVTIWQHRSGSTLAQVMVCCLMASKSLPEPMLTYHQCCHSCEGTFTGNFQDMHHWNTFRNWTSKITATSIRANYLNNRVIFHWYKSNILCLPQGWLFFFYWTSLGNIYWASLDETDDDLVLHSTMATVPITLTNIYCQTSNISRTLVANKIVAHSHVDGTLTVSGAPTTSSFSTQTPGFNGLG